jgi:hypothetical protein
MAKRKGYREGWGVVTVDGAFRAFHLTRVSARAHAMMVPGDRVVRATVKHG